MATKTRRKTSLWLAAVRGAAGQQRRLFGAGLGKAGEARVRATVALSSHRCASARQPGTWRRSLTTSAGGALAEQVGPTRHHRRVPAGGQSGEAYEVDAKEMDVDGVAPRLLDFEQMRQAFHTSQDFDAVEEVLDEMLLQGLLPVVRVHDAYSSALCERGDLAGMSIG